MRRVVLQAQEEWCFLTSDGFDGFVAQKVGEISGALDVIEILIQIRRGVLSRTRRIRRAMREIVSSTTLILGLI